jgi:ABC-type lipoprotein export system ATPase subunit
MALPVLSKTLADPLGSGAVTSRDAASPRDAGLVASGLVSALAGPFDFAVPPGGCLAITGASGSGKSLLLRMIADLDEARGRVSLGGIDRAALAPTDWRARCPYVAATSGWWAPTAIEHFAFARLSDARALAERLGLESHRFDAPVSQLSTGERQRMALIRALVLDAPALLLDEPTGALDGEATARVADLMAERLARGLILVLVTHDPALALELGTERRVMRDRKLGPA